MTESEKEVFATSLLSNSYDLKVLQPDYKSALIEAREEITNLIALNETKVLSRRHKNFQIKGTSENDYKEKFFEFNSTKAILAGIRHVGGNINRPFINVTASFAPSNEDLLRIKDIIKKEFKVFNVSKFSMWLANEVSAQKLNSKFKTSRSYLSRRIKDLNLKAKNTLSLYKIQNDNYYDWYKSEYQNFHKSNPKLKDWVTSSEKEDLDEYRDQNLLFGAYKNDSLIGLIGAKEENILGLKGVYIGELLIAKDMRGQGLALEMQKSFLEQIGSKFEAVWGTIDAVNISSIKTAKNIGRKIIRQEFFFD